MTTTDPGANPTTARALWFTAARNAELIEEPVAAPRGDEVTVRAIVSLVSAGTELLVYRGELPAEDDLGLATCKGSFGFPVKYAYQVVGQVVAAGEDADYRPGDVVFARHPHQELFTMTSTGWLLRRVPATVSPERAAFVNLLEVALNCMLDVPVRFGDVVAVYGQGVVGSFCAQLARRTAGVLVVVDPIAQRREAALRWGADAAVTPEEAPETIARLSGGRGADVCIEASGAPPALQDAIRAAGQEATIAEVSFFGARDVHLRLSPEFHYRRQRIVSSQVSSVGSGLQPRWDFARRNAAAFGILEQEWLETPVSHRIPFDRAPEAYRIIDERPNEATGILLVYGTDG
ncbi:MAG TPA: zinc-binding alcohol dehydrogenase [Acidimicrobiales bacterium]|jgi:2-desacetyl-2-hydroxyethyl bacteriochlorophyllide A dehydrogenase|nr:zinc-binding alcohol dehydrogenase [Acidimicrobiales bacterium]